MPYLSVRTSAVIDDEKKLLLQGELAKLITVIPGKNENNCMIDIAGGCDLYMRGGPIRGAFVDLRLFTASPDDAKRDFLKGLCAILAGQLSIEKQNVYCNMIELAQWGTGDSLSG